MARIPCGFLIILCLAFSLVFPCALNAQSGIGAALAGDIIEEREGRGLLVRSSPAGATVFIDGIERGRTPLRLESLGAGVYFVRLEKEGYSERRFRARVRLGSLTEVSLELREALGRVLLRIQPAPGSPGPEELPLEPIISVDGQVFRENALELPEGFRTVAVRAFGWEEALATVFVEEDSFRELEFTLKPAAFKLSGAELSRREFNPANSGSLGTTAFNFEVSAPGTGSFTVIDPRGNTVLARQLEPFETWSQSAVWDGRDRQGRILGDGVYTLTVRASSAPRDESAAAEESSTLEATLDSSRVIEPFTLSSGKSGLLYAPLPRTLPPGSFQIEGSLLAGSPPESGGPWKSLPFSAAGRASPLERLELSAALNVIPRFQGKTDAGIAGGAKWLFLNTRKGNFPLAAAAGLNAAWTGKYGLSPFGMASGIELYFPVSAGFPIGEGRLLSLALSPSALWTGDEGFPWEAVPRLLVSGGLAVNLPYLGAGLSMRLEHKFGGGSLPSPLMIGGEIKIFPPPSSFVFSALGGVWIRDGSFGAFGGLGIGMIH